MKKERKHIFKAEITRDFLGKFHFISYSNREIPPDLLNRMNCALQDLAEEINKDASWKKRFIEFYHYGNKYRSVSKPDPHSLSCDGCVFWNQDMKKCYHPYYGKGTKGNCEGIIYIKEKTSVSDSDQIKSASHSNFMVKCFIRKNDADLRHRIELLGYGPICGILTEDCIECNCLHKDGATCLNTSELHCIQKEAVDCGTNVDLFLAIAALNRKNDYNQWFVNNDDNTVWSNWYKYPCTYTDYGTWENPDASCKINKSEWHKATVQELIDNQDIWEKSEKKGSVDEL